MNQSQEIQFVRKHRDSQCIFMVEKETLEEMKRVAIAKKFESMSHFVRTVVEEYLAQEKK